MPVPAPQAPQVAPVSTGQALVYALQNAGLNKLGETLQSQIAVANAIMATPGPKLFLAPDDQVRTSGTSAACSAYVREADTDAGRGWIG